MTQTKELYMKFNDFLISPLCDIVQILYCRYIFMEIITTVLVVGKKCLPF